jgi:purine-nucleoside phosphorylase
MTTMEQDWWQVTGLTKETVPEVAVLEGTWWRSKRLQERLALLDDVRELDAPDWFWGTYRGHPVVYASMYGAARAVEPVVILGKLGMPRVVQIGSCGGIAPDAHTGDLLIPDQVAIEEGVSRWYHTADTSTATPELVERAQRVAEAMGIRVLRGTSVTEDTLLGVRPPDESVPRWIEAGYVGVDMETSAVFSAAEWMGMERLSLIYIWDEYALHRRWSDPLPPEVNVFRRKTERALFEIALHSTLGLDGDNG